MNLKEKTALELDLTMLNERVSGAMFLIEGIMEAISPYNPLVEERMRQLHGQFVKTMSQIEGEYRVAVEALETVKDEVANAS